MGFEAMMPNLISTSLHTPLCGIFCDKHLKSIENQKINIKQAGAELGQAQLKLELDFISINLYYIDEQYILYNWIDSLPTTTTIH